MDAFNSAGWTACSYCGVLFHPLHSNHSKLLPCKPASLKSEHELDMAYEFHVERSRQDAERQAREDQD